MPGSEKGRDTANQKENGYYNLSRDSGLKGYGDTDAPHGLRGHAFH